MKKTSTLTHTSDWCKATLAHLWSKTFAPSDTISRRVLFFCLTMLMVAGSYTSSMAVTCPGTSQGTGSTPNSCTQYTLSGGAGAYWSVPFVSGVYYTFGYSAGSNTQVGGFCVNGTNYTAGTTLNSLSGTLSVGFSSNGWCLVCKLG